MEEEAGYCKLRNHVVWRVGRAAHPAVMAAASRLVASWQTCLLLAVWSGLGSLVELAGLAGLGWLAGRWLAGWLAGGKPGWPGWLAAWLAGWLPASRPPGPVEGQVPPA